MTWGLQVTQVQAGREDQHQEREVAGGRRRRGEGTDGYHLQCILKISVAVCYFLFSSALMELSDNYYLQLLQGLK